MKKSIVSMVLVLVLIFSLAACGSKGSDKKDPEKQETAGISFETTDLKGNTVKSEDIFSKNKITMVNLWGTYCGPCIAEMPDLAKLDKTLEEKDCDIVGIVIDVYSASDTAMVRAANDIIDQTGVEYLNLVPWSSIFEAFPAEFVPTTYFVDSEGKLIGEAAIGSRGADDYEAIIDQLLETIE